MTQEVALGGMVQTLICLKPSLIKNMCVQTYRVHVCDHYTIHLESLGTAVIELGIG